MDQRNQDKDARTTPGWLRLPALALCLGIAFWFGSAIVHQETGEDETWLVDHPHLFWFARWSMFTYRNRTQVDVDAEVRYDREWQRINLPEFFPARWDSGYRYTRTGFRRSRHKMSVLGAALCDRMEASPDHERPTEVRFTEVTWRKRLGRVEQPRPDNANVRPLVTWQCDDPRPPLPQGRRL